MVAQAAACRPASDEAPPWWIECSDLRPWQISDLLRGGMAQQVKERGIGSGR